MNAVKDAERPVRRRPSFGTLNASLGTVVERYTLVLVLLAIVAFFSVWTKTSDTFPTTANLQVVIGTQSVLAIAALAALIPLVAGQFDFSVGAVLGLSSIATAAALSEHNAPIALAALVGIGVGAAVGLVNGLLVTRGRVNSLIVTLGVSTIIAGLVTWKTGGNSIITGIPASLTEFGTRNIFGLPALCYVLVVIAAVTYYLLVHTPFGRYLYAVGSNSTAAKLVGLRVDRLTLLSFVASGTLAGAAGVLEVARTGTGNPQIGPNYTLPALAAAFLSAAAIHPGRFNVGGTLVAIFFLAALTSGLNLAGVEDYVSDLVYGTALIAGIGLAAWLARRRGVSKGVL